MKSSNLWILTEERPKNNVIGIIIEKFAKDYSLACFISNIKILPILNKDKSFSFIYEVKGLDSPIVKKVYLITVSGYSSFVDFLVFYQDDKPSLLDRPIYAIEETKTDDAESRNTGIFQRASKFVFIEYFYPKIKKLMLYSLKVVQKQSATQTNIFGTRCLLTLGVEILGKTLDPAMKPFASISELIETKNAMKRPPKNNVPILLLKKKNVIFISGRLVKSGSLSHDPNIGSLSLIAATLRFLGWAHDIVITHHGLFQKNLRSSNKFIKICNRFNISLANLVIPPSKENKHYWKYETKGEKLGTIFIHLVVENFTTGVSIYENHAGCERGYFLTKNGEPIAIKKYIDRELYKNGDKKQIIHLPDLVLIDFDRTKIINIEGKTFSNMLTGIAELQNFDAFEKNYIQKHYPGFSIRRTVVLYGGSANCIEKIEVSFLLNKHGKMILSIKAPELFVEAINNLINYWGL